jgi:hypothetical protein
MVAAFILVFALAALVNFAATYVRAVMLTIASEPLSEKLSQALGKSPAPLGSFDAVLALNEMCPELNRKGKSIGLVRVYYRVLEGLRSVLGGALPSFSVWADHEMETCARYVAVLVDRRLRSNFDYAASVRSL